MKKFIIVLVFALAANTSAFAQRWVNFNVGAYAGLNCTESSPIAGAFASIDVSWFRAEIDAGWTYFWTDSEAHPKDLFYLNPSVGAVFGYNFKMFVLIGMTNWFGIDKRQESYRTNILCPKMKVGGEIPLFPFLNINVAWNCVMNPSHKHFEFKNSNLLVAGITFKF